MSKVYLVDLDEAKKTEYQDADRALEERDKLRDMGLNVEMMTPGQLAEQLENNEIQGVGDD